MTYVITYFEWAKDKFVQVKIINYLPGMVS